MRWPASGAAYHWRRRRDLATYWHGWAYQEASRSAPRDRRSAKCVVGARAIIHSGVVIGADGFGFCADPDGMRQKIEQLGVVRIGDDVEIGANTCIDRGGCPVVGRKLDNLIQIGHNVRIATTVTMAGCIGIAGSAKISRYCTAGSGAIPGSPGTVDHVHITAPRW